MQSYPPDAVLPHLDRLVVRSDHEILVVALVLPVGIVVSLEGVLEGGAELPRPRIHSFHEPLELGTAVEAVIVVQAASDLDVVRERVEVDQHHTVTLELDVEVAEDLILAASLPGSRVLDQMQVLHIVDDPAPAGSYRAGRAGSAQQNRAGSPCCGS